MVSSSEAGPIDSASAARSSRNRWRAMGAGRFARMILRDCASGWAPATARRKSSSSGSEPIEEFFRVERGHAAAAGAGDGLAIDMVLHVARGEHAAHAGCGGHALGAAARHDVALAHVELATDDLRIRRVADGDEQALHGEVSLRPGLELLRAHAPHPP